MPSSCKRPPREQMMMTTAAVTMDSVEVVTTTACLRYDLYDCMIVYIMRRTDGGDTSKYFDGTGDNIIAVVF